MWKTNRERIPERILRNADDLYVPAHRVEFVKRLPIIALNKYSYSSYSYYSYAHEKVDAPVCSI